MSDLAERCARALGFVPCDAWQVWGHGLAGPDYMKQAGDCEHAHCYPRAQAQRYGEESGIGWAMTGPLVPRYRLSLVAAEDGYFCSDAELEREVKAPTACAAVAEWVAKYAPPQPGDGA